MNLERIKRDKAGLAETRFCRETLDGGLDLQVGTSVTNSAESA